MAGRIAGTLSSLKRFWPFRKRQRIWGPERPNRFDVEGKGIFDNIEPPNLKQMRNRGKAK
jgi:hypothetical protein